MDTTIPRVFISYSWSCADRVIELAERLMNDGVDVVLDKWELKEGQDKYAFMERSVTDNTITKVLMICDKSYAEKANNREGGVGNETMVISPEVYAKAVETKYIPIIFERDGDGKEYVPAYLKSRIYIDMSNDDVLEENYEKLLRNLHNKPENRKPVLGKMPEYLNTEVVSLAKIRGSIKQIKTLEGKNPAKLHYLVKKINDDFINTLTEFAPAFDETFNDNFLKQVDATKPLRDLFIDYVEVLIGTSNEVGQILCDFFEQTYNGIYHAKGRNTYNPVEFEFGFFMIWELFIDTTAVLLHFENYKELRTMLNRTYFLRDSAFSQTEIKPHTFVHFRHDTLPIKNTNQEQGFRLYSPAGDIVSKREKLPILSTQAIANADVVLYQLSYLLDEIRCRGWIWFPALYVYLGGSRSIGRQQIWSKMVSLRHCETLLPLFGVNSKEELVDLIQRNKPDKDLGYSNCFERAPTITQSIKIEDIATLP